MKEKRRIEKKNERDKRKWKKGKNEREKRKEKKERDKKEIKQLLSRITLQRSIQ